MNASVPRSAGRAAVVVVLAGAGTMVALMQTFVLPMLPQLPRLLGTSVSNASWAVTATLLTSTVATPLMGRLGDLYGRRRIMTVAVLFLTAGSVVCALSSSLLPLLAGRTLQGLGICVIPLGISVMRDVIPPARLGPAVAMMSASLGVGGALGLPASAAVAQRFGWHAPFWCAAVLGALFAALIATVVPESPVRVRHRFDPVGAVGLSVGLVALLLAISKGGAWGWTSPTVLGLLALAVVVLAAWGRFELRQGAPIVDLRATARRPVLMTNLATVAVGFAMYAVNLTGPQILQQPTVTGYGQGLSMLRTGLFLAPGGLTMIAIAPLAARVGRDLGPRACLLLGTLVIGVSDLVAQALLGSAWGVLVFNVVNCAGVGLAYGAMPTLIMRSVPEEDTAAANGLNALARSLGTSSASTVIGLALGQLSLRLGPVAVPSEAGIRVCLAIGAVAALLATLVELAIPGSGEPAPSGARDRVAPRDAAAEPTAG
jgi:MFS family permease